MKVAWYPLQAITPILYFVQQKTKYYICIILFPIVCTLTLLMIGTYLLNQLNVHFGQRCSFSSKMVISFSLDVSQNLVLAVCLWFFFVFLSEIRISLIIPIITLPLPEFQKDYATDVPKTYNLLNSLWVQPADVSRLKSHPNRFYCPMFHVLKSCCPKPAPPLLSTWSRISSAILL